jgi:hypothetical protein
MSEGMAVVRVVEGRLVLSCACCCYVHAYQAVCLSIGLCTSLLLHLRVRCGGLSLVCGVWRVASRCGMLQVALGRVCARFSLDASLVTLLSFGDSRTTTAQKVWRVVGWRRRFGV